MLFVLMFVVGGGVTGLEVFGLHGLGVRVWGFGVVWVF